MDEILEGAAAPHRVTVDEYLRMEGILLEGRYELVDGTIVRMSPTFNPHMVVLSRLNRLLVTRLEGAGLGDAFGLMVGLTLPLDQYNAREPDLALGYGRLGDYLAKRATSSDMALVVEVADTSLRYDRGDKARRYARAGIADYWIVSVRDRTIELRRDPAGIGYHTSIVLAGTDEARPLACPHIAVTPSELFVP